MGTGRERREINGGEKERENRKKGKAADTHENPVRLSWLELRGESTMMY